MWWMIAFVVSIGFCGYLIYDVLIKWRKDPIILSFESQATPIGSIPFPAVSICPIVKSTANIFNYTDVYRALLKLDAVDSRNVTSDEIRFMKVATQFCENRIASSILEMFPDEFADDSILSIIKEMAPQLNDTIVMCRVFDLDRECSDIFFPIFTEVGLCYTFNVLNMNDLVTDEIATDLVNAKHPSNQPFSNWSLDLGFSKQRSENEYPYSVYGTGLQASLVVYLRVFKNDIDHLCGGGIHGFNIMLHPPNEGPQVLKKYFYLSPGKTVALSIEPKKTTTSDDARAHRPQQRRCFFNSERKLRFYKQYTLRNCELECLSNYTLEMCECVKYSMPRGNGMKICGPAKMECVHRADGHLFRQGRLNVCNCLPPCSMLTYGALASQADFDLVSTYSYSAIQPEYDLENASFSRLVVGFNEEHFSPTKRLESFSKTDLLANCGGLFGLFMGASLLSIVEMIYYFTIRIYFTRRRNQQHANHVHPTHAFIPFTPQNPDQKKTTQQQQAHIFTFLP